MQTRVSVRNLRIREDTAKYLRNLDVKSAFYDPKTRAMRSNPNPDKDPTELDFAGDNFERYTGDTRRVASQQLYEFAAYDRGQDVHMIAMPTQAERLHDKFQEKQETLKDSVKDKLINQYGGAEHNQSLPDRLKFGQTEVYREYAPDGSLIKGQETVVLNTKYEEDRMINNHTAVWGSFWHNGQWGYKCCCAFVRNSYCTGEAGAAAFAKQKGERIGMSPIYESATMMAGQMRETIAKAAEKKDDKKKDDGSESKKVAPGERNEGKAVEDFDQDRLKKALKREENLAKMDHTELDDRKRKYNSMGSYEVTEEEMEAYMLKKNRGTDDPLNLKDKKGAGGYDFV
uniref:Pre-mRNA-splicing factor SLU7 n=1 Tax=Hemiselmis andersenii TaxID=464988 RepID=A0A6U4RSM2_HEMAN